MTFSSDPVIICTFARTPMGGSGLQAAIMAHDTLAAGMADVIVAGGKESMSGAPYLKAPARLRPCG